MHRFRDFLKEPVVWGHDELTWGAIVLTFLGCIGIITLALLW